MLIISLYYLLPRHISRNIFQYMETVHWLKWQVPRQGLRGRDSRHVRCEGRLRDPHYLLSYSLYNVPILWYNFNRIKIKNFQGHQSLYLSSIQTVTWPKYGVYRLQFHRLTHQEVIEPPGLTGARARAYRWVFLLKIS